MNTIHALAKFYLHALSPPKPQALLPSQSFEALADTYYKLPQCPFLIFTLTIGDSSSPAYLFIIHPDSTKGESSICQALISGSEFPHVSTWTINHQISPEILGMIIRQVLEEDEQDAQLTWTHCSLLHEPRPGMSLEAMAKAHKDLKRQLEAISAAYDAIILAEQPIVVTAQSMSMFFGWLQLRMVFRDDKRTVAYDPEEKIQSLTAHSWKWLPSITSAAWAPPWTTPVLLAGTSLLTRFLRVKKTQTILFREIMWRFDIAFDTTQTLLEFRQLLMRNHFVEPLVLLCYRDSAQSIELRGQKFSLEFASKIIPDPEPLQLWKDSKGAKLYTDSSNPKQLTDMVLWRPETVNMIISAALVVQNRLHMASFSEAHSHTHGDDVYKSLNDFYVHQAWYAFSLITSQLLESKEEMISISWNISRDVVDLHQTNPTIVSLYMCTHRISSAIASVLITTPPPGCKISLTVIYPHAIQAEMPHESIHFSDITKEFQVALNHHHQQLQIVDEMTAEIAPMKRHFSVSSFGDKSVDMLVGVSEVVAKNYDFPVSCNYLFEAGQSSLGQIAWNLTHHDLSCIIEVYVNTGREQKMNLHLKGGQVSVQADAKMTPCYLFVLQTDKSTEDDIKWLKENINWVSDDERKALKICPTDNMDFFFFQLAETSEITGLVLLTKDEFQQTFMIYKTMYQVSAITSSGASRFRLLEPGDAASLFLAQQQPRYSTASVLFSHKVSKMVATVRRNAEPILDQYRAIGKTQQDED